MGTPTITTARLRVEPFSDRHLTAEYVAWLNDPEVVRFSEQRHRQHTLDSALAYLRSFAGTPHHFWAIVRTDHRDQHIGNINAYVDEHNAVADVGILIGEKSSWGAGYGGEAWSAVCDFLLTAGGMRKVTGGTASANVGMLAVMQRTGMQRDGVRERHYVINGREADLVHMALFRTAEEPTR